MVDSDWVGDGSVVIGKHGPLVSEAELPVEPDRGGQSEEPLADADEHPTEGAATMLSQPELIFEGVDDRLDPLAHPAQRTEPGRLILAIRADQHGAQPSDVAFELGAGQALVGQDDRPRGQRLLAGGVGQQRLGDLALTKARVATHQLIGMPSGAHSRYSLKPQYQRLWLRS
jgi:hypothetical protein